MAREYARVHDYYFQLHELQPPQHLYHHHPYQTNPVATPGYELTVGGGAAAGAVAGGACADAAGTLVAAAQPPMQTMVQPSHSSHSHTHHGQRKRKNFSSEEYEMSGCESALSAPASATRKRKASSYSTSNAFDDEDGDDARSTRTLPDKKQNHSEIEKRRRDKMNTYITELSSMIPMCGAMARKLDKLTVLRMAVRHLRSVRGALSACPLTARPRPAFLSERELNALILHLAQDCFLMVVGCDRGRLLYVSASVSNMLNYEQSELLGQSLFDILHPKDVAKVKEQLSSSDLSPRERLIDAKTMMPVKTDIVAGALRLCPGARRSFFCRIKCRVPTDTANTTVPQVKGETETPTKTRKKGHDKKYCVVQCTGYLKSWAPADMCDPANVEGGEEGDACNLSCLVAVGRTITDLTPVPMPRPPSQPMPPTKRLQYVSRHANDGKFLFVDQRVTLAVGFLPQELLGTSLYEYVSGPELGAVARTHKTALLQRDALHTPPYSFRRKDGTLARIQTHFKPFRNPWTKDVECLVANNTTLTDAHEPVNQEEPHSSYDMFRHKTDLEMQRLIDSQVESHKIGSAIAEEALTPSSSEFSPDLPAHLLQDAVFSKQFGSEQSSLVDNIFGVDMASFSQVRNNVYLSSTGPDTSPPPAPTSDSLPTGTPPPASPPLPHLGMDGNGEAAMAVIMSLLEADGGLDKTINFADLPWPLP